MKQKTFTVMDYGELDRIVLEWTGVQHESVSANEWNNDSSYVFNNINGKLDEYDLENIFGWISRRNNGAWARKMLNFLCLIEAIEPGDYLIEVSW